MSGKNLTILLVITLVVVIAAMQLNNQNSMLPSKQKLFPDLMNNLNDITQIEVTTANDKFTLNRTDKAWVLAEKHNYPADLSKIRQALVGTAELTTVEAKTAKPELYSKIGVADVTEKDSTAVLLTLKKQSDTLASVLVGNDQFIGGDSDKEIYVRKAGDTQSWLVTGNLSVDKTPMDWLNKSLTDIEDKRVHEVTITHSNGEKLRIFRESEENQDYQLAELTENTTLSSPYMLKQMAGFLAGLNMDDVTVPSDFTFDDKDSTQAVFKTFDGLEVTVTLQTKDSKHYAKLVAVAGEPVAKPQTTESKEAEDKDANKTDKATTETAAVDKTEQVKTEVAELNQQLGQWIYVLPNYKVDSLLKKKEDLVKKAEQEGDLSDIVNKNTNFSKGLVDLLKPPSEVKSALGNPSTALPEVVPALGSPVTVN